MVIYELFSSTSYSKLVLVAILKGEVGSTDDDDEVMVAADFFLPSVTDIEKIGEIQITGDIDSLPTYWTFDGN